MESTAGILSDSRTSTLDVSQIYAAQGQFVWMTLQRLGVREADLEDVAQEVFIVVHRRLDTFDGTCELRTWLYGICRRIASMYRRRAHRRHETSDHDVASTKPDTSRSPEDTADLHSRQRLLDTILDRMDIDRRAAFVMFEIDGMSCPEIAELLGIPLGTVHSRVRNARFEFNRLVSRHQPTAKECAK